jgi:hypothetical protein
MLHRLAIDDGIHDDQPYDEEMRQLISDLLGDEVSHCLASA